LNERHYGALQGKNKEETRVELGAEQYLLWRRSFAVPTPEDLVTDLAHDPRYRNLAREETRTTSRDPRGCALATSPTRVMAPLRVYSVVLYPTSRAVRHQSGPFATNDGLIRMRRAQ
jgi:hypothetical protein